MHYWTIARAWLTELRLNVMYEPWRLVHRRHVPVWLDRDGLYACALCGSASPRIQRQGSRKAAGLGGRFA